MISRRRCVEEDLTFIPAANQHVRTVDGTPTPGIVVSRRNSSFSLTSKRICLSTSSTCAFNSSTRSNSAAVVELAPEEWTFALPEARQEGLARRAVHIWRSDFEG